jgi:hypothetical protein
MMHEDDIKTAVRGMLKIGNSHDISAAALSVRGSDRVFYRVLLDDRTAIAIHYDTKRVENAYYADIAAYLGKIRVPVPRMLAHDAQAQIIILEDLGETDLFSLGSLKWPERRILYQKTLGAAQRIHRVTEKNLPDGVRFMNGFDPGLYRWEQDYFLDNFVKGYCDLTLDGSFEEKLRTEFSNLSGRLCAIPRSLIHRDLQSRNVMVRDGEPYFIDFQGMRLGNFFYDLASLLCDPYVAMTDEGRDELLSFYYVLSSQDLDWDAYQAAFWDAAAERLMQALGAFGFLGKVRGIPEFLGSIPAGLNNLNLAVSHAPSLASLRDVILLCQVAVA